METLQLKPTGLKCLARLTSRLPPSEGSPCRKERIISSSNGSIIIIIIIIFKDPLKVLLFFYIYNVTLPSHFPQKAPFSLGPTIKKPFAHFTIHEYPVTLQRLVDVFINIDTTKQIVYLLNTKYYKSI